MNVLLNPTAADLSRTADEGEDEDERDDEMSEPARSKRTEKRKEIQTDETAKELQAPLPKADPSHASSSGPSDETQEQLERSSKQARTARKGVETLRRCLISFPEGTLRTSKKLIPSNDNGRNAQKQQEESVEEEGRRKKPSLPILHARSASSPQRDETHRNGTSG